MLDVMFEAPSKSGTSKVVITESLLKKLMKKMDSLGTEGGVKVNNGEKTRKNLKSRKS